MIENSVHYLHEGERPAIDKSVAMYDSLIIPAHFVAARYENLSGFLNRLKNNHGTEYYINPQLPRYRKGDDFRKDTGDISEWNQSLLDYYDPLVKDILSEEGNIRFRDLTSQEQKKVVKQSCDFQLNFLEDAPEQENLSRYGIDTVELVPRAIIPWYVKMKSQADIASNQRTIKYATDYLDAPIKPCLFFEKDLVKNEDFKRGLTSLVDDSDIQEVFVWIEDLDKPNTTTREYVNTINLIQRISNCGVEPHMFYGGYFSHLLAFFGLRGVGFGTFHQESKKEKTESSGGSGGEGLKRYYFNPVKEFLNIPEAVEMGSEFDERTCDCHVCEIEIHEWDDLFAIGDEYQILQRHYIASRRLHSEKILNTGLDQLLDEIEESDNRYREPLNESDTAANANHLRKWRLSINHYISESDINSNRLSEGLLEIGKTGN
ncbi:hypothetical protein [Natrialba asiatica]|uniref:hypothetical protein n=1 Tax=Natrialba asiatica TaxID=64602 RepID=UPI0012698377|nr:hypothetical protein [Natrialba asiatica]